MHARDFGPPSLRLQQRPGGRAPSRPPLQIFGAGQLDVHLQGRQLTAALEPDLDLFVVDIQIFLDHRDELFLEHRQIFRRLAVDTLVREQNLQPLLRRPGGSFTGATEEIEQVHAVLPSRRWKKLRRSGARTRCSICSPISRFTASRYALPAFELSSSTTGMPRFDAFSTLWLSGITPSNGIARISSTSSTFSISPFSTRAGS